MAQRHPVCRFSVFKTKVRRIRFSVCDASVILPVLCSGISCLAEPGKEQRSAACALPALYSDAGCGAHCGKAALPERLCGDCRDGRRAGRMRLRLLMCDKEAIEVQKILPFLSDTWPLCRIGRAVIRASQSCRQSCNKSQCPACGCRSHHSCTHAPQFSRSFPAREWGSVLQRQGACGQCP